MASKSKFVAALLLSAALYGCGSTETPAETSSDVSETVSETSEQVTTTATPTEVSFEQDILPILQDKCAQCHIPGGPGSPHWELTTAVDAASQADTIGRLTASGYMPPWPASNESVPFIGDLSLTDAEIASVEHWVAQGGGIDVDGDLTITPTTPPSFLANPDAVVTPVGGAYQGSPDLLDDYRCFIVELDSDKTEWITASSFEPDQIPVVHHAIVSLHDAQYRERADQLSAMDPESGYTCYGTSLLEGPQGGGFQLNGWAPGQATRRFPEGHGVRVDPGDFMIVQIHYHFENESPPDLSRMAFELADEAELEASGGELIELDSVIYLGPAEIPCEEGDTHELCDRDAAVERVRELYGELAVQIPLFINIVCGTTPDDFSHMTGGEAWSSCELPVENPGEIVSVFGHLHELGTSFKMTKNPGQPDELVLLDIPDWDFDWQYLYEPSESIILDEDDTVLIECGWGRDRAPYDPVGYVLWAEGTVDEMCYSSITTKPVS